VFCDPSLPHPPRIALKTRMQEKAHARFMKRWSPG
jgi:hypothetical protein